jgi:hypothetical protein
MVEALGGMTRTRTSTSNEYEYEYEYEYDLDACARLALKNLCLTSPERRRA